MILEKCVLKICRKHTGEHSCRSAISITSQSNFIEIALLHGRSPVNLMHILRTSFPKNTTGRPLLFFTTYEKLSENIKRRVNVNSSLSKWETVRSSRPEVFIGKRVPKICSKFTEE